MNLPEALRNSAARTALVLGSGLGSFVDGLEQSASFSYGEIGLPSSKVPGHAGHLRIARLGGEPLLIAQGRVHLYEGWKPADLVSTVVLLHRVGIRSLILTNAAGSLHPDFLPGSWMMISDHINLTGRSPLQGGANFVDMSEAYSSRLRKIFRNVAAGQGMPLHEGIYSAVSGPQYETPAEIRMLQRLGADAVGMSTVLETIQARALGLEVAAFSCLTNWGAGISLKPIRHEEISAVGNSAIGSLRNCLRESLPLISSSVPMHGKSALSK